MKYATTNPPRRITTREYVIISGDEPTLIAWKMGGSTGTYGRSWRELCRAQGIIDPMQVAGVPGASERFLLGERIRIGQRIPL